MTFKIRNIALAFALATLSAPGLPAGLGKLSVLSGLGQPLRAEVELTATREELSTMAAKLAPSDAFKQAGIEFAPALTSIKFDIAKRSDGRSVLKLTSDRPISEPFLDMLIQLDWAQGRLLREYTFLLDPPDAVLARQQVAPVALAEDKKPKVSAAAKASPGTTEESSAGTADTRRVKRGDTLGRIARATKPEGVTLDQMLVALFRANKRAFVGNNMNRLRAGAILAVPSAETAAAVAPREARRIVVAQASDFNAYRRRVAAAAAASSAQGESTQTSAGKIEPRVEEKAPVTAAETKDQLKVSKADSAKTGKAGGGAPLEEDVVARGKALSEAKSRVGDLEKNVSDLQKAVELKNKRLAEAQKQATPPKVAPAEQPKPQAAVPAKPESTVTPANIAPVVVAQAPAVAEKAPSPVTPAAPPPVQAAPAVTPPAPAIAPAVAPAGSETAAAPAPITPEPAKSETAAAEAKPPVPVEAPPSIPKPPKVATPAPAEEPGFLASLMDNPLALYGGGAGLLALLGLLAYRSRRQAALDGPTPSTMGKSGASSVFGTTGGQSVDTSASSIQTDFSHSGMSAIDSDEGVDPVAEADVYMAYGRDAQAEEILLDALKNEPARHAIHVKLLEIYAQRKNFKQFETLAGELYAQTGGVGVDWERAATMGRKLDPANPLYGGKQAAAATGTAAVATVAAVGAAGAAAIAAANTAQTASSADAVETPKHLKDTWTLPGGLQAPGLSSGGESTVALPETASNLSAPVSGTEPPRNTAPDAVASADAGGLDFDLGLDLSDSAMPSMGGAQVNSGRVVASAATPSADAAEAFAGTESMVARGVMDFDLGDAAESVPTPRLEATQPDVPVMDLERTDVAGTLIDFNLDELSASKPSADIAVMDLERTDVGGNLLDFNFDLDENRQASQQRQAPKLDMSGIDLNLPPVAESGQAFQQTPQAEVTLTGDEAADVANPEVATKLELAKAYEEMGDRDGARELLDEVIAEGNANQQGRARQMLARFG